MCFSSHLPVEHKPKSIWKYHRDVVLSTSSWRSQVELKSVQRNTIERDVSANINVAEDRDRLEAMYHVAYQSINCDHHRTLE